MRAAVEATQNPELDIAIISKMQLMRSNSVGAAGGTAAVMRPEDGDSLELHAWDTAAGLVIVREAGGRVTDFKGGKYSIYNKQILATNGRIHRQIQRVLLSSG